MSNPVLNDKVFERYGESEFTQTSSMSVSGSINKTLILLGLMIVSAFGFVYMLFNNATVAAYAFQIIIGSAIVAFIVAMVLSFKNELAQPLSIVYAILEGVVVGGISIMYASLYQGIVFQAVTLTVTVLFLMLVLYKFRVITVNDKFRSIMKVALISVAVFYLGNMILGFFGMNFLAGSGPLQIGINIVIVVVAALSLLLDFDFIEKGSEQNLPKYYEWYAGFGLLVTLIWLYLEILKLLARLRGRN